MTISDRKQEHLKLAHQLFDPKKRNDFDRMHLVAPALPETYVDQNILQVEINHKRLAAPFFIEAMTGGNKQSQEINRHLARIAAKANIAMALGSASLLEKHPERLESFLVARQENPDGVLLANVNPNTNPELAQKLVTALNADALQIHVNVPQEIVMPEGDRDFLWLKNMDVIRQAVNVPVIVKAVGFGFDHQSLMRLKAHHYEWIDVGGRGGTNFVAIENQRGHHSYDYLQDLGLSTIQSLVLGENTGLQFIASGGVRQPLDIIKSLALGAHGVGIANTFLETLRSQGEEGLFNQIQNWKQQLASLIAMFGAQRLSDLTKSTFYFDADFEQELMHLKKQA